MQFTQERGITSYRIHGYDNGSITVAIPKQIEAVPDGHQDDDARLPMWRDSLHHSFIITPEILVRRWGSDDFNTLQGHHFAELRQYEPEIVLFGSGTTLRRPPTAMLSALIDAGIGVEIMDSGAACRTYNILVNDARRVLAALMV